MNERDISRRSAPRLVQRAKQAAEAAKEAADTAIGTVRGAPDAGDLYQCLKPGCTRRAEMQSGHCAQHAIGPGGAEDVIHSARAGAVPAARMLPKGHRVKSWPEQFRAVVTGRKRFEMRRDDRNYQPGDTIELLEFRPELNQLQLVKSDGVPGTLTGRSWMGVIGYVSRGGPLPAGWCAFDVISVEDVNRLEGVRR